jgi:GMP synthase-like glutamine amidotransferase
VNALMLRSVRGTRVVVLADIWNPWAAATSPRYCHALVKPDLKRAAGRRNWMGWGSHMQPTLSPGDNDPHDVLEIAPDVVLVARAEEELSRLAREAKSRSGSGLGQPRNPPPLTNAPPASPPPLSRTAVAEREVPAVDTSFRAARTDDGPSMTRRIGRGLAGLLLAVCVGAAAMAWRASGEVIKTALADWAPQFATKSSPPADPNPPAAQDTTQTPAAQQSADAATDNATPAATAPATPNATASAAPNATASSDQTQQLQSMVRDLASLGQEVALLKASLAELKASNEQMSRDMAKVSEQNQKLKTSARAAVPPVRKPPTSLRPTQAATGYTPSAAPYPPAQTSPPYPPPQASAPYPSSQGAGAYPPPAAAPYPPPGAAPYPPQTASVPPPQAPGQSFEDPDIPRPPMPVR